MNNLKKSTLSLAIASTLALVGCGGGSSGGGAPEGSGTSKPVTESVSGSAVKGIMRNATVTAYELNSNGDRKGEVGTSQTDSQGAYEIDLSDSYTGGLIEVEVTVNSSTRMVCDASACGDVGQEVELPSGFKLNTITSPESAKVSAPVTAWSSMAAKRTKKLVSEGKPISDATRQASAEINQVAGFDVAKTTARDVNDLDEASDAEAQSAVMNAVVAEIVFGEGDGDAASKLEQFSNSLEDGIFGNGDDSIKVADLANKTRDVVEKTPNLNAAAKDALNNQAGQYDSADGGLEPTYDEELDIGEDSSQESKINAFRQFVSQARTWATSIEDLDSDALGAAVQVDADTMAAALGDETLSSLKMSLEIIGQSMETIVIDAAEIQTALETGGSVPFTITDGEAEVGTATLSFSVENGAMVASLAGEVTGEAGTAYLPFELQLNTDIDPDVLDFNVGTVSNLLASTTTTITGQISDGSGLDLVVFNGVEATLNLNSAVQEEVADAGITDEQITSQFASASLAGDVELFAETGERFRGLIEGRLVRLTENRFTALNDAPLSIKRLRAAGQFTAADGSTFNSSATLNINNASSVDTFALLDYSGSERYSRTPVNADELQPLADTLPEDVVLPSGWLNAWESGNGSYQGYVDLSGYVANGEMKVYQPGFEPETATAATEAVVDAVIPLLPSTLTLEYQDANGQPVELELNVQEALSNGTLGARARFVDNFEGAAGVEFAVYPTAGSFLPIAAQRPTFEGAQWALVTTDLPGNSIGGIQYSNGREQLAFRLPTAGAIEAAETAFNQTVSVIDRGAAVGFTADAESGNGAFTFVRAAELQNYQQCLDAPEVQLAAFGLSSFLASSNSEQVACANATLFSFNQSNELEPETLNVALGIAEDALANQYGELADRLTVEGFDLNFYEGRGDLSVWSEFPKLETADNFVDASFTITTALDIPELPAAKVIATATRNSLAGGKVLANVKWDGGQYSLELASDDIDEPSSIDARFFNPQGYELKVSVARDANGDLDTVTGDAFIDGEDVGDVSLRNGAPVITYPNGEETIFETLF